MVQARDLLCGSSEAERRRPPALVRCDLGEFRPTGSDPPDGCSSPWCSPQAGPVLRALKLILWRHQTRRVMLVSLFSLSDEEAYAASRED